MRQLPYKITGKNINRIRDRFNTGWDKFLFKSLDYVRREKGIAFSRIATQLGMNTTALPKQKGRKLPMTEEAQEKICSYLDDMYATYPDLREALDFRLYEYKNLRFNSGKGELKRRGHPKTESAEDS